MLRITGQLGLGLGLGLGLHATDHRSIRCKLVVAGDVICDGLLRHQIISDETNYTLEDAPNGLTDSLTHI